MLLRQSVLDAIVAHARAERPRECCGLLLGRGERIDTAQAACNVDPDPARRFEIDPAALLAAHRAARAGGPEVLGYYHSHPDGPPRPSRLDEAQAAGDGRVWAIIGQDEAIACWRDGPHGFTMLSHRVIQG